MAVPLLADDVVIPGAGTVARWGEATYYRSRNVGCRHCRCRSRIFCSAAPGLQLFCADVHDLLDWGAVGGVAAPDTRRSCAETRGHPDVSGDAAGAERVGHCLDLAARRASRVE